MAAHLRFAPVLCKQEQPMWPWKSQRRRPSTQPSRKHKRGYRYPRLLFEQLEDRTLLSSTTQTFAPAAPVTQFSNASLNTFLGASFDKSASFGSIESTLVGGFGAEVNLPIPAKAGSN